MTCNLKTVGHRVKLINLEHKCGVTPQECLECQYLGNVTLIKLSDQLSRSFWPSNVKIVSVTAATAYVQIWLLGKKTTKKKHTQLNVTLFSRASDSAGDQGLHTVTAQQKCAVSHDPGGLKNTNTFFLTKHRVPGCRRKEWDR